MKLLYKLDVLLARKHLRYTVGWHLIRGLLVYVEAILLDLLADLILIDVDVFKLSAKLVLFLCDYAYSLLIVTPNHRRLVELQRQAFEQAAPLLHL